MADRVTRLAAAIAKAEGFYADGSLPQRTHNPGDLEEGDLGWGTDAAKTIFASDALGWAALHHQVNRMLTGTSHVYAPSDTIAQVAVKWTGGDAAGAWAAIVAQALGVTTDTTLQEIV